MIQGDLARIQSQIKDKLEEDLASIGLPKSHQLHLHLQETLKQTQIKPTLVLDQLLPPQFGSKKASELLLSFSRDHSMPNARTTQPSGLKQIQIDEVGEKKVEIVCRKPLQREIKVSYMKMPRSQKAKDKLQLLERAKNFQKQKQKEYIEQMQHQFKRQMLHDEQLINSIPKQLISKHIRHELQKYKKQLIQRAIIVKSQNILTQELELNKVMEMIKQEDLMRDSIEQHS